ncbi:hypothetical protein BaRGS_00024649, partial [Batillaria attramentaria]
CPPGYYDRDGACWKLMTCSENCESGCDRYSDGACHMGGDDEGREPCRFKRRRSTTCTCDPASCWHCNRNCEWCYTNDDGYCP